MTTTLLPDGFYAKIHSYADHTQITVNTGSISRFIVLPKRNPTDAEIHKVIETLCQKIQKIIQSNTYQPIYQPTPINQHL